MPSPFLKKLFGVEDMTPEQQLKKILALIKYMDSDANISDVTIICPSCKEKVSLEAMIEENKTFLIQALDKDKELDGDAKKELDYIKGLIKRVEDLYK